MDDPKVSVILTSYNKPQFVGQAIESVLQQTMADFELFIMDDNSNQKTEDVFRAYLNDSRVHYHRSDVEDEERPKKTRYAVLINQALSLAKGQYISYLTDDNYYHKKRLEIMSKFLDDNPDIKVAYSAQQVTDIDLTITIRKTLGVLKKAAGLVDHCSVMHRRSILDGILQKYGSYWDEDPKCWGYGDAVFWDRMNESWPFYPIDQVLDYNIRTPLSFLVRMSLRMDPFKLDT
ncbi:glycosyltransferase family 2 protein [Effusibacillus consociatus]|uniref:Glycosyltransferase family 2 protein n=1 Tax=Effusibacillus consociatus TaxID=1117041 RepID=A0ABV9PUT9_9BACL